MDWPEQLKSVVHQPQGVFSVVVPLAERQKRPAQGREPEKLHHDRPVRAQHHRGRDVAPVERDVQKPKAAETGAPEIEHRVVRSHEAQYGDRRRQREDELGEKLPYKQRSKTDREHAHLRARPAASMFLGLEQRGLHQRLGPHKLWLVKHKVPRNGSKRVAGPDNAVHEDECHDGMHFSIVVDFRQRQAGSSLVAGGARGRGQRDQNGLFDGPGAGIETEPEAKQVDSFPGQNSRQPPAGRVR
ncbi:hypothetical protein KL928_000322 [Ogataea angusta]|uniref:Uncharacterized protein n=1 Tax=Pichia angusta TaxID=870730 RepID=A0AAN6DK04_PICAN|nr:uncharacterized protein KL928_000322 [Ogataea angusta]KAG7821847.1 hypothetical protein KL928_000322 [Ogataea angusta]